MKTYEKSGKKPIILHKSPKIRKSFKARISPYFPKALLKRFLRWLRLRNTVGELLVKEETNIDDIVKQWNKDLIQWISKILLTGLFLYIATIPFIESEFNWRLIFLIFCYGIIAWIIVKIIDGLTKRAQSIARSLPKSTR